MYPLNVLAILIQLFWAGCLIEMFMTTVAMLLITTVVQKPEETINPVFGVRSSFAYTTDMKKAFYVHKPIYSIEKQKFLSAEALIRLYDDTYGFISPELFITAAERNGNNCGRCGNTRDFRTVCESKM